MGEEPRTRWQQLTGGGIGKDYAARFAELARSGQDVHGEATLCSSLVPAGSRILDAGCGTGRVAIRLAEVGHDVVGVDLDESMLAVAQRGAPHLTWVAGDLAVLPEDVTRAAPYDLVVLAGNVVPLLAPGTLEGTLAGLGQVLHPAGLMVAGFGLDVDHLPPRCPVTPLTQYDDAAAAAGLLLRDRFGAWDAQPYRVDAGYAVSVHRRNLE